MERNNGRHPRYHVFEAFNVVMGQKKNSLKTACSPLEDSVWLKDFSDVSDAVKMFEAGSKDVKEACRPDSLNTVNHPVLLLYRHDPTNIFHFTEDFLTVFSGKIM
jgi:hypothetical protein